MISLALIGKGIQHSKSQNMYEELLGQKINYDLIDCQNENEIPQLEEMFSKFDGVSITSPYKTFFLNKLKLDHDVKKINAVNCIAKIGGDFKGFNTDLIALDEIINNYIKNYGKLGFHILGDGVMSKLIVYILNLKKIPFQIHSRKTCKDLEQISLKEKVGSETKTFIVNCCSRSFIFKGVANKEFIFWDMNYSFLAHQQSLPLIFEEYVDGLSLLKLQAKYALNIWGILNNQ
tara:strand:+ start:92 stop:790 length:699 start_codon:yes stop_codon:yes gene_type:complete